MRDGSPVPRFSKSGNHALSYLCVRILKGSDKFTRKPDRVLTRQGTGSRYSHRSVLVAQHPKGLGLGRRGTFNLREGQG